MTHNITLATCVDANLGIDVSKNLAKLINGHKIVVVEYEIFKTHAWYELTVSSNINFIAYSKLSNESFDKSMVGLNSMQLCKSFDDAMNVALTYDDNIVVIGCEMTILQSLTHPLITHVRILTDYDTEPNGNLPSQKEFAKLIPDLVVNGNDTTVDIRNTAEKSYLDLLKQLLTADIRPNRTDTLTQGVFTEMLKFPLHDIGGRVLPLITTKKVPFNSVYEELKMFVLGETDTSRLEAKSIPIWRGNTSRPALDAKGLTDYPVGTLGPVYGYQWTKFGGDWTDPKSTGVNQLQKVIDTLKILKTNPSHPDGRRMVVSAWNPLDLDKMCLAPCHHSFEFHCDYTKTDDKFIPSALNCRVNMRSADLALGVPFNIASYAMLTHIISLITGIPPGTLAIVMTDCHIYTNHIEGIKKQILRTPKRFPHIRFNSTISDIKLIEDINYSIIDYVHDPFIKLDMVV
jgi:thymidylate synthase